MIGPALCHRHLLVVEDDAATRRAVQQLVEAAGWTVITAASVVDGRRWLARRQFAGALVDLGLPDGDGFELVVEARQRWPQMPVLVLTSARAWASIEAALRGGARGYLLKEDLASRLVPALGELAEGGAPLSAQVARQLLDRTYVAEAPSAPPPPCLGEPAEPPLTAKEREVLCGLDAGLSYAEIAATHAISVNTVRSHIRSLYDKLRVHSRGRAVRAGRARRDPSAR